MEVDELGVDKMRVDKIGVDEVGINILNNICNRYHTTGVVLECLFPLCLLP